MSYRETNFTKLVASFILGGILFATTTFAGAVYEIETKDYTQSGTPQVSVSSILAEGGNLKMSTPQGKGNQSGEMIFLGAKKELLMIDHEKRRYTAINEEQMAAMTAKIEQAMSEYQKMLENVPPAQREMMEKMMKNRMPQGMGATAPQPNIEIKDTGKTQQIGIFPTRKFVIMNDNVAQNELWVTDWSNLQGSEEITDAFKGMAALFSQFTKSMSQGPMGGMMASKMQSSNWMTQVEEIGGLPIQTKMYGADGTLERETRILRAESKSVDPSEFAPPKKYKRQKMDGGR